MGSRQMTSPKATASPVELGEAAVDLNFDLSIVRSGKRYRITVEHAPVWLPPPRLERLHLDWVELGALGGRNLRPPLELVAAGPAVVARTVGERVFRQVFAGSIGDAYEASLAEAARSGQPLVLRMRLGDAPELRSFPWESLWDPQRREPVGISTSTNVVRYLDTGPRLRSPARPGPLRILFVASQPCGKDRLAVEREWRVVEAALAPACGVGQVELLRASAATVEEVGRSFVAQDCQVLHFAGHGEGASSSAGGVLAFEREGGGEELVTGERLAAALYRDPQARGLRLAVLNACHTADSGSDSWAGAAQSLVSAGFPAAVAMRGPIPDQAAIRFARAFYEALAAGSTLPRAISLARRAIFAEVSDLSWLWPVLFIRTEGGRLVDPSIGAPPARKRRRWWALGLAALAASLVVLTLLPLSPTSQDPPYRPSTVDFTDHPDCPSAAGLELGLVRIEPGEFVMGSDEAPEEEPQHPVTITDPFCLAKTEVTEALWTVVMSDRSRSLEELRQRPGGDLPQGKLSWNDAQRFLIRLNKLMGADLCSLPTEAQWEYAARAGSAVPYGFGGDSMALDLYGNCGGEDDRDPYTGPAPVGSLRPNALGLFDLHGNQSEWVNDWYQVYGEVPLKDPSGPSSGQERVRRGGSYITNASNCRSASREKSTPEASHQTFGFRVACRLASGPPASSPR